MTNLLKIFISCIFFLTNSFLSNDEAELNCNNYRTGSFVRYIYNKSGLGHWTRAEIFIQRNDSIETQVIQNFPQDTIFYRIQWKTPCRYELHFLKATNTTADTIIRYYSKRPVLKYSIQQGNETYYIEKKDKKTDTIWLRK